MSLQGKFKWNFKKIFIKYKSRLTTESDLKMNYTIFAIASLKPLAISNYNISQNAISMNKSLNFCHLKMAIKSF